MDTYTRACTHITFSYISSKTNTYCIVYVYVYADRSDTILINKNSDNGDAKKIVIDDNNNNDGNSDNDNNTLFITSCFVVVFHYKFYPLYPIFPLLIICFSIVDLSVCISYQRANLISTLNI